MLLAVPLTKRRFAQKVLIVMTKKLPVPRALKRVRQVNAVPPRALKRVRQMPTAVPSGRLQQRVRQTNPVTPKPCHVSIRAIPRAVLAKFASTAHVPVIRNFLMAGQRR